MKAGTFKKIKGITLIELIVTIAVFLIILAASFSLYTFGNSTFSSGDDRYDIQTNLRSAMNYVTEQIRYSTDIQIMNSVSSIPSPIPQFYNYIYYNDATNSIIHLNKYFTKSISIVNTSGTNTGNINFYSDSPYKSLRFNIYAKKKSQEYNVEGNLEPLNIDMGTAKVITGPDAAPAEQTGTVLEFKTASNYISESLIPTAQIGDTNKIKKFTVDFDSNRTIFSVEIITAETINVTNPNVSFSGNTVTVTTDNTLEGAKIIVRVTFSDTAAEGNIFDYKAIYNSETGKWEIYPDN